MVQKGDTVPPKSRYNVSKLLLICFVFHLVYIASVFDCYFTSPVVNGMNSFSVESVEAKRLVLIVGDGLRADLLFSLHPFPNVLDSPRIVAPYLRSIVETRGAFGISHTRVPTESRPGHVAIIGGMYEDVSAVTKGWKTNPVDFDSVFNQSSNTFSFGSPDILPMFARGATPGKVKMWSYHEEEEDFTKDATALDLWVLEHVKKLFNNATHNAVLDAELRADKVIIFLHLLGLDTTGHSYRPHSKEYMHNIQVVDDIVRKAEYLVSSFYGDNDTSFIFTADHGMSAIGNHGDGHPDNTRTPLIAWGKGVRGPLPDIAPGSHDSYSEPWGLNHLFRRDVEQADVASLISALIGIDWPVNSVGVLPDVDPDRPGYLDPEAGQGAIARAALVNAKVILEQYRVKDELKRQHTLWYRPFQPLDARGNTIDETPGQMRLHVIEQHIMDKEWVDVKRHSLKLIEDALQGLHYLQTYDRFLIRAIVTFAYIGWAAYSSIYIFGPNDSVKDQSNSYTPFQSIVTAATITIMALFWTAFTLQKSPWMLYVYIVFPAYFWQQSLVCSQNTLTSRISGVKTSTLASWTVFVAISLLAMVLGYTHRFIWSVGFCVMGIVWPVFWDSNKQLRHPLVLRWALLCLFTSIFPLLPVDKSENLASILIGGLAIMFMGLIGLIGLESIRKGKQEQGDWKPLKLVLYWQILFIAMMMVLTASSVSHLQAKTGLPLVNQISGWIILVFAPLLPFLTSSKGESSHYKILKLFLGFGPSFVILSISVEGMFYVAYSATLITWIEVEGQLRYGANSCHVPRRNTDMNVTLPSGRYEFRADDLRIALFFLFFVQVGFFGTGNVASISSFYLAPVYRLIPVFSPFFMAALLIFKIVVPYIILAVAFAELNKTLRLPPFSLLLVALTLVDGMTLTFFYKVQDTGSWLDIGQSISFFCITSLLLLWSAGICAVGELLMADTVHTTPTGTKMD